MPAAGTNAPARPRPPLRSTRSGKRSPARSSRNNHKYPVAGLDPAIHGFFHWEFGASKDVGARGKPGHGDFLLQIRRAGAETALPNFPRTALRFRGNDDPISKDRVKQGNMTDRVSTVEQVPA